MYYTNTEHYILEMESNLYAPECCKKNAIVENIETRETAPGYYSQGTDYLYQCLIL